VLQSYRLLSPNHIRTCPSSMRRTRRKAMRGAQRRIVAGRREREGRNRLRSTLRVLKHRSIVPTRNLQSHGGECVPSQTQTALTSVPVSCSAVLGLAARGADGADLHRGRTPTRSVSPTACLVARAALVRRRTPLRSEDSCWSLFKKLVPLFTRLFTLCTHEHEPVAGVKSFFSSFQEAHPARGSTREEGRGRRAGRVRS
jgi:hypothetical protein